MARRFTYQGKSWMEEHWRESVLWKYHHRCAKCDSAMDVTCHHIKPKSTHPELRFVTANGVALCRKCHNTADAAAETDNGIG